jgi:hypothetical protein
MNAKIIRADNRLRVYTAIALVVIIVCGFVTYDWTQRALVEIEKLALKMAAAVVGVTTALVAVSEARKARRSLSTGKWPPPGTRVLMDTPVVEGGPARRRAKRSRLGFRFSRGCSCGPTPPNHSLDQRAGAS